MSKNPIRLAALVSYTIFPPKMGGQKGIALFYLYLEKLMPVTLITIEENSQNDFLNASIIPILGKNKKWRYVNPFLFFKIKSFLKKEKITHLIFEHPYYGWLVFLLKQFTDIKIIIHSHNMESLRFKSTGRWWWSVLWHYEKWTHRFADLNFFITDEDRQYAISKFKLNTEKCITITYGFEMNEKPELNTKNEARHIISRKHGIAEAENILLFNGTLDYLPNLEALHIILKEINRRLISADYKYKIIICGKNLPPTLNGLEEYKSQNIIYAGFVEEINLYFKGADIFINPVIEGGGIKTKVVEALGFDLSVVSTKSGAIGIPDSIVGSKLKVVADDDWEGFAEAILQTKQNNVIPDEFFRHFYWGNISAKAIDKINAI
jgi:polysaccharide biosynthesis protein PslH